MPVDEHPAGSALWHPLAGSSPFPSTTPPFRAAALTLRKPLVKDMPVPNQDPSGGPSRSAVGTAGASGRAVPVPGLGRLEPGGRRARPSDGLIGSRGSLSGCPGAQLSGRGEEPAWGSQITAAPSPAPAPPPWAPGPAHQAASGDGQPLPKGAPEGGGEGRICSPPLPHGPAGGPRGSSRGKASQRRLQETKTPGGGSVPCMGRRLWGSRWPSVLTSPWWAACGCGPLFLTCFHWTAPVFLNC